MSHDTTRRPASPELAPPTAPPASTAFLPCSDCRDAMRVHYYALDSRPVCPKCRVGYKERIDYGKGPGSLERVLHAAGGAALLGAAALSVIGWVIPILRILPALAVAWYIAKAVNKASGDYYLKRNQWVGGIMLYLAIGLAGSVPATVDAFVGQSREERAAAAAAVVTEEEADEAIEAVMSHESSTEEASKGEDVLRNAGKPQRPQGLNESAGGQLQAAGPILGVAFFVFLTLIMPFLAILGAGMYGAGLSLFALVYTFYKFREWTSDGVSYDVTGPFRVGTGPIKATW